MFAGASITILYDSTVVDVSINFERLSLELNVQVAYIAGFSESVRIAYVRLERALERASLSSGGKAQHHGPLSNQLGSPGESEAKNISFRAEVQYFCRSMTVSTTTQRIPSITGIMPSLRRRPMVPCNTHSVFFQGLPRFLTQNLYQISHSHWHLRPCHQVQRWDYDGCRQPWFVTSPPYRALYS